MKNIIIVFLLLFLVQKSIAQNNIGHLFLKSSSGKTRVAIDRRAGTLGATFLYNDVTLPGWMKTEGTLIPNYLGILFTNNGWEEVNWSGAQGFGIEWTDAGVRKYERNMGYHQLSNNTWSDTGTSIYSSDSSKVTWNSIDENFEITRETFFEEEKVVAVVKLKALKSFQDVKCIEWLNQTLSDYNTNQADNPDSIWIDQFKKEIRVKSIKNKHLYMGVWNPADTVGARLTCGYRFWPNSINNDAWIASQGPVRQKASIQIVFAFGDMLAGEEKTVSVYYAETPKPAPVPLGLQEGEETTVYPNPVKIGESLNLPSGLKKLAYYTSLGKAIDYPKTPGIYIVEFVLRKNRIRKKIIFF